MRSKCKKRINDVKGKKQQCCFSCDKIKEVCVGKKNGSGVGSYCKRNNNSNKVECFMTNRKEYNANKNSNGSNSNGNVIAQAYKEGFNSLTHNINKVKI
jgi:hypothetical protein